MNDKYNPNINLKPVEFFKHNLMNSVKKFQITIIQAETGSGKTIFIPKIFYFSKILFSPKRTFQHRCIFSGKSGCGAYLVGACLCSVLGFPTQFVILLFCVKQRREFCAAGICPQKMWCWCWCWW